MEATDKIFFATVTDWDMTKGGVKVPLNKDGMRIVDSNMRGAILKAIRRADSPNGRKPRKSMTISD